MVLTGPDVSHHQGNVSWSAVRSAGHSFAIVKATEGSTFKDSQFAANWAGIRANGMTRGAYHFLRTGDGAVQARHFLNMVGDLTGSLAALDVERAGNGTEPSIHDVWEFVNEFRRLRPGHPLIVYTGRWYWVGVMGDPRGVDIGPLWHSEYDGTNPFAADVANGPELDNYGRWPGATFWQHTSTGRCPGISGNCDLNIFYGDIHALIRLTGVADTPPSEPDPEEDELITVIAPPADVAPRYWAALMDGYVRIFNFWDPHEQSPENPLGYTQPYVWCPNEEYDRGVGVLYKPVQRMKTDRDYDVIVASAKRTPVEG